MPEVDFQGVAKLFQQIAPDRTASTTNAAGTTISPASGFGGPSRNIQEQPSSSSFDQVRMRSPYAGSLAGDERIGTILTSTQWIADNRAIALHAGPNSANWTLPLRASEEAIKSGRTRFAQARVATGSNSTTYFDQARVSFEFQTGNIMPIPLFADLIKVPYGLEDFYLFLELVNQAPLILDGPNEGQQNFVWIFYTSLQFPQLVLRGYFDPNGLSWADTTDSPTAFTWNCDFTVYESTPELWQRQELESAYAAFMAANANLRVF